jgi:hypothetical protein
MNPVALRLLNQQLVCPQFDEPAEVVRYMGAMQAQEYRMMRWAVAMRTRKPSAKAFKRSFDSGQIVRLHLMRGTWQLVAAEDYWPMLDLCSHKAIAVIKGWMSSNRISIPDEELAEIREILSQTAAEQGSVTKEDFVQALAERDIRMDDHRLSYHIRMAELSGVLCSGDLLPMKATYALTANKVGQRVKMDRDEALMFLTRKYFQSRQPATLEDFVWWSGLNVSDCRKGIALLGDCLHVEKFQGRDFYLTDDCRTRGFRKGKILLIPPYDEYLISYKGCTQRHPGVAEWSTRDLVLPPEHRHRAHNNSGIFQPIIARDGIVCGNWSPFREDCQVEFFVEPHASVRFPHPESSTVQPFVNESDRLDVQAAWQAYVRFRKT